MPSQPFQNPTFSAQLPSSGVYFLQLNMGKNTVHTTILKLQGDNSMNKKHALYIGPNKLLTKSSPQPLVCVYIYNIYLSIYICVYTCRSVGTGTHMRKDTECCWGKSDKLCSKWTFWHGLSRVDKMCHGDKTCTQNIKLDIFCCSGDKTGHKFDKTCHKVHNFRLSKKQNKKKNDWWNTIYVIGQYIFQTGKTILSSKTKLQPLQECRQLLHLTFLSGGWRAGTSIVSW